MKPIIFATALGIWVSLMNLDLFCEIPAGLKKLPLVPGLVARKKKRIRLS